jgi:hypothetical protein
LSTFERQKVFDEVSRLRQQHGNLGVTALRSMLSPSFSKIPSRETLRRWLLGKTAPTTSLNTFEARPSPGLSFFLGAWLGDGWADESDGGKRLLLKVRARDFAEEFARAATVILEKKKPYRVRVVTGKRGTWYLVKVTSMLLYDFVNQPFSKLHRWIEPHALGFLRAFFTAEGNPIVSIQSRGPQLIVVLCVSNTDLDYLTYVNTTLVGMGYHPTRIRTSEIVGTERIIGGVATVVNKPCWQTKIVRVGEIDRFLSEIGFADQVKQEKATRARFLMEKHGTKEAAQKWREEYVLIRGVWVKKAQS